MTADDFARLYAHLGERERALDALAQAADERSPRLLPFLADPAFDELRGDPRFRALLQRVGAPVPGATLLAPALTTVALLR